MGPRFLKSFIMVAAVGVFVAPSVSNAETMENLVRNGFAVSKITNGKSGLPGWNLTKGDQKYFCPARLGPVYIDSKKMFEYSTSGRPISMDRATYDSYIGGPDSNIPYWKDVQVGHVKSNQVNPCLPTK